MTISRRLRFEILRRDNHACRYCGATAPIAPLTVDHVLPVALGGADTPTNLVTACADCNAGKTSIAPDSPLVADVDMLAVRWRRALAQAAEERAADHERSTAIIAAFDVAWATWWYEHDGERYALDRDDNWPETIRALAARGLTATDFDHAITVAMNARPAGRAITNDRVWSYFCGVCWRKIDDAETRAREIIEQESDPCG